MSAPFSVPTIDISAYVGDGSPDARATVAAAIDHACRTVGFMQIVGHGIPADVIDGFTTALDDFFGLPLEEKKRWVRPSGENRGYSPPKSESLSYSLGIDPVTRMNDFFEAFNVGVAFDDFRPSSRSTRATTPATRGRTRSPASRMRSVATSVRPSASLVPSPRPSPTHSAWNTPTSARSRTTRSRCSG